MSFWRRADGYWFGRGSPTTFGLFRILIGAIALINLIVLYPDFEAWFTEKGFVPWWVASRWLGPDWRVNVFQGVVDENATRAIYLTITAAAFLTMIGLWSRLATAILAFGYISLHHRNPILLHSGDTLIRLFLIYLALGPAGAACSMDRFIGLWRGRIEEPPKPMSMWPQRLITFQLALMYFTTVWHKAHGTRWREFSATWFPDQLHEFDRFWVPGFLSQQPIVGFTTIMTLLVELALATLVFAPSLRKWVLILGLMLHGYIDYRYNIPYFGWIVACGYLCFYDGHETEAWAKRLGERLRRFRVVVATPKGREFVPSRWRALKSLDPLDLVEYEIGEAPVWAARDEQGRAGSPSWLSWSRSVGSLPIGWVPGLWRRLMDRSLAGGDSS